MVVKSRDPDAEPLSLELRVERLAFICFRVLFCPAFRLGSVVLPIGF